MTEKACLYWIKHKEHTDIFTQGYVGVTKNYEKRWRRHIGDAKNKKHDNPHLQKALNKYNSKTIIQEIILFASEKYCYEIENKLRNKENIGWNICSGGTKPPISKPRGKNYISPLKGKSRPVPWIIGRKKTKEECQKIRERRKVKVKYQNVVYESLEDLASFLNIKYSTLTNRIYRNSKKWGYEVLGHSNDTNN